MKQKKTIPKKIDTHRYDLMAEVEIVFAILFILISEIQSTKLLEDVATLLATVNVLISGITLVVTGFLDYLQK